jgi:hypothetical protein
LKAEKKDRAIYVNSGYGPSFSGDIGVLASYSASTCLGDSYTNDTGLDGRTFFTGSHDCKVKEIEVFEIS